MQFPVFIDPEFVDASLLNPAVQMDANNFGTIGQVLHTSGLLNPSSLNFTFSALTVNVSAPQPFNVLFGAPTGLVVGAHGTVDGQDTQNYAVNFASLVPSSGSVTAYLVASYLQIGQELTQVPGPPIGHPDNDPNFAPFQFWSENEDSLNLYATTTPPDNATTFELGRLTLTAGQTSITSIDTSHWRYASAVLNPTGVTPGTYNAANVTVQADGRVTAAGSALGSNNTWTGNNTFSEPVTVTDPTGSGGLIVSGASSSGASVKIIGNGSTTPNKFMRVLSGVWQLVNSAYSAVIMQVSDAGDVSSVRNVTASGTIAGSTVNSTGNMNVAGTLTGGAVSVTGNVQGSTVDASNGNVTALNGRLRATYGAYQSGDGATACILNDFAFYGASPGYIRFPNGMILQWGNAAVGAGTPVYFPIAFPNACLRVVVCEGAANSGTWGSNLPTLHGVGTISNSYYVAWACFWSYAPPNQGWIAGGNLGEVYFAVGY